jgi:hypothetical protein
VAEFTHLDGGARRDNLALNWQHHDVNRFLGVCLVASACSLLVACAPELNWRRVALLDSGPNVWLPCKPSTVERTLAGAGGGMLRVRMRSCDAGGQLWAVSLWEAHDEGGARSEVNRWLETTLAVFPAPTHRVQEPWRPPHWPSGLQGVRLFVQGKRVDGSSRQVMTGVVVVGNRLIQLTVVGERLAPDAVQPFFDGLEPMPRDVRASRAALKAEAGA